MPLNFFDQNVAANHNFTEVFYVSTQKLCNFSEKVSVFKQFYKSFEYFKLFGVRLLQIEKMRMTSKILYANHC